MKKTIIKYTISILAILLLFTLYSSIVVTYQNEYRLIRVFGKVDRVITEPGISFKVPFIEEADTLPQHILLYDLSSSDVITKDKKTMVTDTYILWKVTDPLKFAQSLSGLTANAEGRINTAVYNAMKTVIGSMDQTDIISARDGLLSKSIMDIIGDSMSQYGIELVSLDTKRLDLPSDNKAAVYERMISERQQMAATYTAEGDSEAQIIRNTTDKEISIMLSTAQATADQTVADGEAEYMKILQTAYSDLSRSQFYSFVRSLDAAKLALTGTNKTLILTADSPIAQLFMGY